MTIAEAFVEDGVQKETQDFHVLFIELLNVHFPNQVSPKYILMIEKANLNKISYWLQNVVKVTTLDELFNEQFNNTVDDWETPYISTPQKVRIIQGRQDTLSRQLKHRFPNDVTPSHLHLINKAGSETLSMWVENIMDAKNIDEVFAETCLAHS